jgi:hypothetical protein
MKWVSVSTKRQCDLSCRRLFGPLFTSIKGYSSPFYHTKPSPASTRAASPSICRMCSFASCAGRKKLKIQP